MGDFEEKKALIMSDAERSTQTKTTVNKGGEYRCKSCGEGSSCRTVRSKTKLMNILIERGRPHEAQTVFKTFAETGHRPSLITYTTLLAALTVQRQYGSISNIVSEAEQSGTKPDSIFFNAVINAFSESGNIEDAVQALLRMKELGLNPTTSTYNTLIKGYGIAGRPERSSELMDLMLEENNNYVRPNIRTFNVLVQAWCKKKKVEEAWKVVRKMEECGVEPDTVTYNTIATCYVQKGETERAEREVVEKMVMKEKAKPNGRTCGIVVGGYCREGRVRDGLRFVRRMKEMRVEANLVVFNSLIKGFVEIMDRDGIHEVLALMKECKVKADVITYSTVMNAWSSAGYMEKAAQVFEEMVKAGVKPDAHAYSILAKGYVRAKEPKKAEELLETMVECRPNVVIFTTVISGWCSTGNMEDAMRVLTKMCEFGVSPNIKTFETLMWGYLEVKQPWKAEEVLQMMRGFGVKPENSTFRLLAEAWRVAGLTDESNKAINVLKCKDIDIERLEKLYQKQSSGSFSLLQIPVGKRELPTAKAMNLSACKLGARVPIICQKQSQAQFGIRGQFVHSCTVFLN
ncbi:pentatricopeptide repeat-containing protein At5g25630 [Eutrema salsugineum]|uniref:pentatricopeptide repeat-containing protein At5g25630 n=1 Tax=Eutrema salsugineum TaxID=72664 RepID=UPI000CED44C8|nr:pentatricopeptide repeat-containing protein At5g25630 [Eutrema salsugineum]